MQFKEVIRLAFEKGATDIHLEPKFPITFRVKGEMQKHSSAFGPGALTEMAQELLGEKNWQRFYELGSFDLTKTVAGIQCRINLMKTDRGVGLAIRLLSTQANTLKTCNLHPSLIDFTNPETGLVIITGPTGSGKTTTLSALIEEVNLQQAKHILTLENPIEYRLKPKKSLIRQRQVGLHTPSFETGLLDSLREDPDIIVVGEMREPEAIRMTLNAAETGHLVFATMHSATAADAIYRIVMSFPPERQNSILAQLADTLVGVVSQKLKYREQQQLLVPVCEILFANHAVKNVIRKGEVSKLVSLLQTGGTEGMWTFDRYQSWLDQKSDWSYPPEPKLTDSQSNESEIEEGFPLDEKPSSRNEALMFRNQERGLSSNSTASRKKMSAEEAAAAIENSFGAISSGRTDFGAGNDATPQSTPGARLSSAQSQRSLIKDQKTVLIQNRFQGTEDESSKKLLRHEVDAANEELVVAGDKSRSKNQQNFTRSKLRKDPTTGLIINEEGRIEIPAQDHDLEELVRQYKGDGTEDV